MGGRPAVEEDGLDPVEVVRRALGLALPGPGDHRAVARAHELLQLGLGSRRERAAVSAAWARNWCGWSPGDAGQRRERGARQGGRQVFGRDVQVVGVGVVEAGGHVLPQVLSAGSAAPPRRPPPPARPRGAAPAPRRSGRPAAAPPRRGGPPPPRPQRSRPAPDARAPARRPARSTPVDLLKRALGEGGEEREPLDLDVEQLAAHRPLLRGRVDVDDVPAQGELAAILHLVGVVVAAATSCRAVSSMSSSPPFSIWNPCGRRSGSGTFSASAPALATTTADRARSGSPRASSAAIRRPTRCGGGARCDSYCTPRAGYSLHGPRRAGTASCPRPGRARGGRRRPRPARAGPDRPARPAGRPHARRDENALGLRSRWPLRGRRRPGPPGRM